MKVVSMSTHRGEIVKNVIMRKGYTAREIAKFTNVNRRSVYNWFSQEELNSNIIFRIGSIINHNFSTEFPDLFTNEDFDIISTEPIKLSDEEKPLLEAKNEAVWQDKYIEVLEKYNELLKASGENNRSDDKN